MFTIIISHFLSYFFKHNFIYLTRTNELTEEKKYKFIFNHELNSQILYSKYFVNRFNGIRFKENYWMEINDPVKY